MFNKTSLKLLTTEQLIIIYVDLFVEEYGAKKSREIADKIYYSTKVQKFIDRLRNEKLRGV